MTETEFVTTLVLMRFIETQTPKPLTSKYGTCSPIRHEFTYGNIVVKISRAAVSTNCIGSSCGAVNYSNIIMRLARIMTYMREYPSLSLKDFANVSGEVDRHAWKKVSPYDDRKALDLLRDGVTNDES